MPRCFELAIVLTALAAVAGCGRDAPPSAVTVPQVTASLEVDAAAQPVAREIEADDPEESPQPLLDAVELEATTESDGAIDDRPAVETHAPERIAVLTPGGPLLVDIWITLDGQPHTAAFNALVQQVLEAGDADGDGRPTWKALAANQEFLSAVLTNAPLPDSRQMKMLIERYDANRDGAIQPNEAAALLGHNAGTAARPLAVRSSRSYYPIPRAASQVWQLLDADRNGRLSADEIRRAPETLLSLDADDDRVITPLELASLREQLEAAAGRRAVVSREASHYAAIHLEAGFDVQRLQYLLGDLYAAGQGLTARSFPDFGQLFHELDINADGWLEQKELAGLLTIEPHLELSIAFERSASPVATAAIDVRNQAPDVAVVAQPSASRIVLMLGNTRLIVSAHDLTSGEQEAASGEEDTRSSPRSPLSASRLVGSQIRSMVHDQCDALFEMLDENADGKLGEREIASSAERLLQHDASGDEQLTGDELPYCMIVAFLRGEPPSEQSFYVPATAATPMSDVEPPPWFRRADLNGDGEISRREFLGSDEQFSLLDTNEDGYISAAEAAAYQ